MDKCKLEGRFVKPCGALDRATEMGTPDKNKKGIFEAVYFNIHTDKPNKNLFQFHGGQSFKKNATLIYYCPFCGVNISEHIIKEDQEEKAKKAQTMLGRV